MSVFQLLMLAASAFFAFKIYEHIQTLQDPEEDTNTQTNEYEKGSNTFSPFSPQVLVEKADKAYQENDKLKALAFLHEARAKEANNPEILFKIGYILQQENDEREALYYYRSALRLDKNNEFIHNAMASIYRKNREFTSARMHLNSSVDINNTNPITYYNYGNLLVDMEKPQEAIEMYKKALALNADFIQAKEELEKLEAKEQ